MLNLSLDYLIWPTKVIPYITKNQNQKPKSVNSSNVYVCNSTNVSVYVLSTNVYGLNAGYVSPGMCIDKVYIDGPQNCWQFPTLSDI